MANETTVSVISKAGNTIWGPDAMDASAPLSVLQAVIAKTAGVPRPAVHLLHDGRKLQGSLQQEGIENGAALQCVLDMVKGSIEESMLRVRSALRAHHGKWNLDGFLDTVPSPNEEHCPNFQNLDWAILTSVYKELVLIERQQEVSNHAGKFVQFLGEWYFGTVDSNGVPAGFGFVLKQSTCLGEYNYDGRGAYFGLFLPVSDYTMPMSSVRNSMLVQGSYLYMESPGDIQVRFPEKNGLFDGTEEEEE